LITYNSNIVSDLLLDMDSKVTTYLSNKTLAQVHKDAIMKTATTIIRKAAKSISFN